MDLKLGWKATESTALINYNTLTTMLGLVGLSIGSLLGGKIVPKLGIWRSLLIANFFNIVSNGIKLILSTPTIFIGRLLFGVFSGMQSIAFTLALNETVPGEFMQYYGMFIGCGYCVGIFFSNFVALAVPLDEGNPDDLKKC